MLALLQEIRASRLAMYVGESSLTKLADFLRGYAYAVNRLRPGEADSFLADFRDWVYEYFRTTENISWEGLILRNSIDETDAVHRFWELLDEYLQKPRIPAGANSAAPANTLRTPEPAVAHDTTRQ